MEVALGADETGAVIASFPIVGTLGDGSPVLDQLDPDRALDVARRPVGVGRRRLGDRAVLSERFGRSKAYVAHPASD